MIYKWTDPKILSQLVQLSDHELLDRVKRFAGRERDATASLIAHLAEIDRRRLYLGEGYSSLFAYCTQVLHLSEHAAYGRIEAARMFRRFPVILEMLEEGSVNLTTVCLLTTHLTDENHREVLEEVKDKSKRQVEEFLAQLHPHPPVPSTIRKLPISSNNVSASFQAGHDLEPSFQPTGQDKVAVTDGPSSAALTPPRARSATIAPLAPERYKVQFTANAETYRKLRLAQNLLRHQCPDGDLAEIFDRALTALLQDLAKRKLAATDRPRESGHRLSGSRHIAAEVKRAVWLRDGGRCAFVAQNGRRCSEDGFLEFHHVTPYAVGGWPTVANIQLRCRAHNGYEAELDFGPRNSSLVRESRVCYSSRPGGSATVRVRVPP